MTHRKNEQKKTRPSLSHKESLRKPLVGNTFIIFDIETTGGNPEKNGITEIFAIKYVNHEIIDTFYSLVNPMVPIPPIVRRMTGITNQMVRNAPLIEDVMPKFVRFIGPHILVSHNTIGDLKFLRHYSLKTTQKELKNFFLCTHLLTEKLLPEAPDKSLGGLATFLKFEASDFHRAEADAYSTLDLFNALIARVKNKESATIEDVIRLQGDLDSGIRIGWAIPTSQAAKIKNRPGVLSFLDVDGKPIFITASYDIKSEFMILSNLEELPKQLLRTLLKAHKVESHPAEDFIEACMIEAKLQSSLPNLRVLPHQWNHRAPHGLAFSKDSKGIRIQISPMNRQSFLFCGPISDRRLAQKDIDYLAKILNFSSSRKGLTLPANYLELSKLYFSKAISYSSPLEVIVFHSRNLGLLKSKLAEVNDYHLKLKSLNQHSLKNKYASLLQLNGVLTIDSGQGSIAIYPVLQSMIANRFVWEGSLDEWLKSKQGQKLLKRLEKEDKRKLQRNLNPQNYAAVSLTIWLVLSSSGRKKTSHKFHDVPTLIEAFQAS